MSLKKIGLIFINLILISYAFLLLIDNYFKNSILSNLDTMKSIFRIEETNVFFILVFLLAFTLLVTNLLFLNIYNIISVKNKFLLIFFVNLSALLTIFFILDIVNLSKVFLFLYLFSISVYIFGILDNITLFKYFHFLLLALIFLSLNMFSFQNNDASNSITFDKERVSNFINYEIKFENKYFISPELSLTKYSICCEEYNRDNNKLKSVGFIETFEEFLIYINYAGDVFFVDQNIFNENTGFNFQNIKTNLSELIKNNYVFYHSSSSPNYEGIKGALIFDNFIYISYIEEKKINNNKCVSLDVARAKFNLEFLKFEIFFDNPTCISRELEYDSGNSGGKLSAINDKLYLTTGTFLQYSDIQMLDNTLGKIIEIDFDSLEYRIVSLGHRNPQGLSITKNNNLLIETEHGDYGGDEINIINIQNIENFGYPIVSYGEHYSGDFREDAPLFKNHESYGFKEPLLYFRVEDVGSHGISDVEINEFSKSTNSYFIGSLNGRKLYEIEINDDYTEVIDFKYYSGYYFERIRDIKYSKNLNSYFIVFEDSPSIAILSER